MLTSLKKPQEKIPNVSSIHSNAWLPNDSEKDKRLPEATSRSASFFKQAAS
jgi:hypothetical protein